MTVPAIVDLVVGRMKDIDFNIRRLAGKEVIVNLSDAQLCEFKGRVIGNRVAITPKEGGEPAFIIAKFLKTNHAELLALGAQRV